MEFLCSVNTWVRIAGDVRLLMAKATDSELPNNRC